MKTIYDFIYSPAALDASVVWYSVRVGVSAADRAALRSVTKFTKGNSDFLFARHDAQLADFRMQVAASIFPIVAKCGGCPLAFMRLRTVEVVDLARFLRRFPAALLNSDALAKDGHCIAQTFADRQSPALTYSRK